jgi:hypothetical protein
MQEDNGWSGSSSSSLEPRAGLPWRQKQKDGFSTVFLLGSIGFSDGK